LGFRYKLVIVFRKDLKLTRGKLAVQAGHASVTCSMKSKKKGKYFNEWYREGQKKVAVGCDDLAHLKKLQRKARSLGLVAETVSDAGLTEVQPGTITCLGVGPGPANIVDKVTGDLSLM